MLKNVNTMYLAIQFFYLNAISKDRFWKFVKFCGKVGLAGGC